MIESILLFVENNSHWAWLIIFVVAFLESMAIVGLLIPGWLLLVGFGTLIGADALPFYPIVFAAYLGAVVGEYLSFLAGYYYHEKILRWPFVAKHDKLIDAAKTFFEKHGIGGVFIGRFFGPTRAVIPLAAGIAEMNRLTFAWVNLVSGLIWAPLYLIPGILVGAAFNLEKETAYHLIFICCLVIFTATIAISKSNQYWKATYRKGEKQKLYLVVLWWAIALTCFAIFARSEYWDLLIQILKVVVNKL